MRDCGFYLSHTRYLLDQGKRWILLDGGRIRIANGVIPRRAKSEIRKLNKCYGGGFSAMLRLGEGEQGKKDGPAFLITRLPFVGRTPSTYSYSLFPQANVSVKVVAWPDLSGTLPNVKLVGRF